MLVVEITQKLLATQVKTLQQQLEDIGIRVVIGKKKEVGYVYTFTVSQPHKVTIRLDEGAVMPKTVKDLKFVLRRGRFILQGV